MKKYGAQEFQEERTKIITSLIKEICEKMILKNIKINPTYISKEIDTQFLERNLNQKFHIKYQSLCRNIIYSNIIKSYEKKQRIKYKEIPFKSQKRIEENEFSLRDKYDLLQQDFIELYDNYAFLKFKEKELENNNLDNKSPNLENNDNCQKIKNIFSFINDLLNDGSVIINKNMDRIIIKCSVSNDSSKKIIFGVNEWKEIFQ